METDFSAKLMADVAGSRQVLASTVDVLSVRPNVQHRLYIEACEGGGRKTNRGECSIVCGASGNKLRPQRIPNKGQLSCAQHGFFQGQVLVQVVLSYWNKNSPPFSLLVTRYQIQADHSTAILREEVLYRGDWDINGELPENMAPFKEAIAAGCLKAICHHCRKLHFAKSGDRLLCREAATSPANRTA